jgi:hypothetical protein
MIYRILDIFFLIFHTSLVIFNLFGWIWRKTRKLNLITLILTGSSWLFLGLAVGTLGYCPLTDWHFRILEKLGKTDLPFSYMKYLVDKLTLGAFTAALLISMILNISDFRRKVKNC